ncbi:hypothetical protein C8A01DRAFT_39552 [Parachaetomium inaequale]|uniref:PH domain-containing protein n=1 Tax=Parachaetomium inaequale TaxID=2588326 RepID=A0AAN6PDH6_9PEZI|nr:hypothetical protein C8A01DRAFT_39552 [Parachaetomium inaequale]
MSATATTNTTLKPAIPNKRLPAVAPSPLAHNKPASNLRPRRTNDDVKKKRDNIQVARGRPRPTTPRIDLLPEKLVFPSRKTPASFLPTPSSISLDTAVPPVFASPSPSPISLGLSPGRRSGTASHSTPISISISNDRGRATTLGGAPAAETDRIVLARPPGGDKTDGKPAVYHQPMQPSAAPPPPSTKFPSPPRQPPPGPVREAFAFLTRGRKKSFTSDSSHSTLSKRSRTLPASSTSTSTETETDLSDFRQSPGVKSSPDMARSPTGGQNPTAKSVGVRCRGTPVTVQITKKTSTVDLLADCSQPLAKLGRPINPDTCVVIEPCIRPGLERRLRQYELVWDVISAWEHDSSNTLIILPDSADPDRELSLSSVPKTLDEPEGFVLPLYFLQRPGKWSQRYITLKENGQIFASKKQDWKTSDKDVARLCHLSDFDLYLPTEAEMRKQLRPPKRYCYAVRSQEKASLFLDSTHYVHFFCTDDPNVARQFRSSVQGWRSWYLVNKKLRLHEPQELSTTTSLSMGEYGYRGRASVDQGPRGRPSIDQSRSAPSREGTPPDASAGAAIPPVPPLPASLRGKKAAVFASTGLLGNGYDERKQQALRQDATTKHRRGTLTSAADDGPFVDGPSLLNRAATAPTSDGRPQTAGSDGSYGATSPPDKSDRAGWFPSAVQHSAEQRGTHPAAAPLTRRPSTASHAPSRARSVRQRENHHPPLPTHPLSQQQQPLSQQQQLQPQQPQPQHPHHPPSSAGGAPQPLIDLTPTFVEPPQWSRENRGRGVRAPQGKPLVDLATGPVLPPSTAARFRDAAAPPKNLVRRPDQAGNGGTLMQQYEAQKAKMAQGNRARGQTFTSSSSAAGEGGVVLGGLVGGLVGGMGRRNTVRSNASGGGVGVGFGFGGNTITSSSRPGTAGGGSGSGGVPAVPGVPVPASSSAAAAAAYMQSRGKVMGVGEVEKGRVKERLRSVDGRGRAELSVRGRREY